MIGRGVDLSALCHFVWKKSGKTFGYKICDNTVDECITKHRVVSLFTIADSHGRKWSCFGWLNNWCCVEERAVCGGLNQGESAVFSTPTKHDKMAILPCWPWYTMGVRKRTLQRAKRLRSGTLS